MTEKETLSSFEAIAAPNNENLVTNYGKSNEETTRFQRNCSESDSIKSIKKILPFSSRLDKIL